MEWGGSIGTLNVCSVDNVLQVFRTSEYIGGVRSTLTYGSATRIYEQGLLPYILLAMVDIRLRSRVQLPWLDKCTRTMHDLHHKLLLRLWQRQQTPGEKVQEEAESRA